MRVAAIAFVAMLLAAACGGQPPNTVAGTSNASGGFSVTDALQPDGPLRGVVFTSHVDRKNPKVHPALAFTTKDTEVTAVIGLGDVAKGPTVTVTWYRVEGLAQRHELFAHEIAVKPGGLAFSQAVAPNGLAPGIYDTVATMDGHVTHTPFVVNEAAASQMGMTGQGATDEAPPETPVSGDSGWSGPEGDLPQPPGISMDMCRLDLSGSIRAPVPNVDATAAWIGPCSAGTLTATVSGPPQTLASSESLDVPVGLLHGSINVCRLAGGSDLPGTVVHLAATGSASGSKDITAPDFGESLVAGLLGVPVAESNVEPGDRITIDAFAMVVPPALGVKTLYVDDGSDLLESVGNLSGSDRPQPCDPLRLVARLVTEYTVPVTPPPVIELCATGVGFDGTQSKNCIRYYTGEVWEGSATSAVTTAPESGPCGNPFVLESRVQLVVAADGAVTGTYDVTGCGVSEPHAEFTGTVTDAGFLFPQLVVFTNGALIPKVSATHAQASLTNIQGTTAAGATWVTTWDLTCKTCR
jgi:hypothetical protein